jgi:hypothetical protein
MWKCGREKRERNLVNETVVNVKERDKINRERIIIHTKREVNYIGSYKARQVLKISTHTQLMIFIYKIDLLAMICKIYIIRL